MFSARSERNTPFMQGKLSHLSLVVDGDVGALRSVDILVSTGVRDGRGSHLRHGLSVKQDQGICASGHMFWHREKSKGMGGGFF